MAWAQNGIIPLNSSDVNVMAVLLDNYMHTIYTANVADFRAFPSIVLVNPLAERVGPDLFTEYHGPVQDRIGSQPNR